MPIYMDIHRVPGIEALHAAEAHQKDMEIQNKHQCKCMTYWIDEPRGSVFCLIEAPCKEMVEEMHRKAHGLVPNNIIEVNNELVESFLGRIQDPEDSPVSGGGLKIFSDSAFRILLVVDSADPVLLRCRLGAEKTNELLTTQQGVINEVLVRHGGRRVERAGKGYIFSFSSAVNAAACAMGIQAGLSRGERRMTGLKMALVAGEPVSAHEKLFGETIQLAMHLNTVVREDKIAAAMEVKALLGDGYYGMNQSKFIVLSSQDEDLVKSLFGKLEENWQDPLFSVPGLCQQMTMSKSKLYRKAIALWGLPPNLLLKEFRLDKSLELLNRGASSIAEATFESGFTSPSYFTKCFKEKFGLLPASYLNSVQ